MTTPLPEVENLQLMSHNPPIVNPRITEEYKKKLEKAGKEVMASPTLSPVLQGQTLEEHSSKPREEIDWTVIDSLLGSMDDVREDFRAKELQKYPKPQWSVLWDLQRGAASLLGRKVWKDKNLYLKDGKLYIAKWDRVKRETTWTDELWIPTQEDILANDWETGD